MPFQTNVRPRRGGLLAVEMSGIQSKVARAI